VTPAEWLEVLEPVLRAAGLEVEPIADPTRRDVRRALERLIAALPRELTGRAARVAELAAEGLDDHAIAAQLSAEGAAHVTYQMVRSIRRTQGIPAGRPRGTGAPKTGWQSDLRALHAAGATVLEMAEATGKTPNTVRSQLSRLGLHVRGPR